MKFLKQFGIIITISFIGELMHFLLPLPISASIYGIIIMFIALSTHMITMDKVRDVGMFLVEIMPIVFVPAAVGIIDSWDILNESLLEYAIVLVFTTIFVMVVVGAVPQTIAKRLVKMEEDFTEELKKFL